MEHKNISEPELIDSRNSANIQRTHPTITQPLQLAVYTFNHLPYSEDNFSNYRDFLCKMIPDKKFHLIRRLLLSNFSVKPIETGETILHCNFLQHLNVFYIDIPYTSLISRRFHEYLSLNSLEVIEKNINTLKISLERFLLDVKDWPVCILCSTMRFFFSSDLYKHFFNIKAGKSIVISGVFTKDSFDSIMCILNDLKLQKIETIKQKLKLMSNSTYISIHKMGVQKVFTKKTSKKISYLFGISRQSLYSGKSVIIPINIEVSIDSIVIKIVFSKDKKPASFLIKKNSKDHQSCPLQPYLQHALEYLKNVNKYLPNSAFLYEKSTNSIVLKLSTKTLFPPDKNTKMVSILLNETIHNYLCYCQGLNVIYDNMIQEIIALDKDSLVNKNFSNESIKQQAKFCRKKEKTLSTKIYLESVTQSHIIETESIHKERILIQGLKKSKFISQVFSSNAIYNKGGIICYPSFLRKHKIQPICESILENNPLIYRKILKLNKEIEHFNYFIELKNIYDNFGLYNGKIYYLFKKPMFIIVRSYTIERYLTMLHQIETGLGKTLWPAF